MHTIFRTGLSLIALLLAAVDLQAAVHQTWIAVSPQQQLYYDDVQIPRGRGFLFVPTMTKSQNEPTYRVERDGEEVATQKPGFGVLLPPGFYQVYIGSGTPSQMLKQNVEIIEGHTTTWRQPFWSGLVINVIDETRTSINEAYELFEEGSLENYGIGFGIEEERGEAVKTWLLPPGVYTVVRVGESGSTLRKFSVRLMPGELTQRNLVIDSDNANFIGFYPPTLQGFAGNASRRFNTQWELSLTSQFNTSQKTAAQDLSRFSLSSLVLYRGDYKSERQFANLRLIAEEGVTKEGSNSFRKTIDEIEFRATYIYRLSGRIGPYLRGVVNTHLFETDVRFDTPRDFVRLSAKGDTLAVFNRTTEVTLEPSFFPLVLRQGLGINAQIKDSFPLNVDLRLGLGARQTFVSNTFRLSLDEKSATQRNSVTSTGLEALLITNARLSRFANFDSEFDILLPSRKLDNAVFSWENRLRIFLTSFINLDLVADFEREETLKRLQSRQQVLLRFSKFL